MKNNSDIAATMQPEVIAENMRKHCVERAALLAKGHTIAPAQIAAIVTRQAERVEAALARSVPTRSLCVPFPGFYESSLDQALDCEFERDVEHMASEENDFYPELVGRDESDISEAAYFVADWSAGHDIIARAYADTFADVWSENFGFPVALVFDSVSSPREYNFETDRLFCLISLDTIDKLRAYTPRAVLAATIKDRHSSRSGFISFYSNDLATWETKPLDEWDNNELETLLLAAMAHAATEDSDAEQWEDGIYESLSDSGTFSDAFAASVDWDKVCAHLREESEGGQS